MLTILLLPVWAGAVVHYVNADADSGGDGTTVATTGGTCAFDTIAAVNAHTFIAGDDVYFECGDTWAGTVLTIDWEGVDADNYSIIGAYEGDGDLTLEGDETLPIIDGNGTVPSVIGEGLISLFRNIGNDAAGYFIIQDLDVYRSGRIAIVLNRAGPYCIVQNCIVRNSGAQGIASTRNDHSLIYNNTVYNGNQVQGNGPGILVSGMDNTDSDYNIIRGNTVYDCLEGIFVGKKAQYTLIEDNITYDIEGPLYYSDASKYTTFRNNIGYYSNAGVPQETGIQIENENERGYWFTEGHKIYDNFLSNCSVGIQVSSHYQRVTDSAAAQNDNHIYNNTLVDCAYNIYLYDGGFTNWTGNYFYNNLLYQTDYPTSGYQFTSDTNISGFTFSNNYINWTSTLIQREVYQITQAASDPVIVADEDNPIARSTAFNLIAPGDITFSNYLTTYFGLVAESACENAACALTTTNGTGSTATALTVDDPLWFHGNEDDPLDDITVVAAETNISSITGSVLTVAPAISWTDEVAIYYRHFRGTAPDIGADEYQLSGAALMMY